MTTCHTLKIEKVRYFGEIDKYEKPRGRGVKLYSTGLIVIGYWDFGAYGAGPYLSITATGAFQAGERYKSSDDPSDELKTRG